MNNSKASKVTKSFVMSFAAILVGLIVSVIFVAISSGNGLIASASLLFGSIWRGSFGEKSQLIETFVFATPLIFTGVAHAIAFKTGLFNIGVEGQFIIGMLVASLVGIIPGIPSFIHILLIIATGALAGAIWAAIPGYLKAKVGTNEVVNTIMMNFIAMHLSNYFVYQKFKVEGTVATPIIQENAQLTRFLGDQYRLNTGIFIAIALVILVFILLWKTTTGYELRAVGTSPHAAEYGGININKNIVLAMAISGAVAGIGGAIHVAGVQHQAMQLFGFPGFGMDGIAVALVAKSHPIGVIFSAILFGALNLSSGTLMLFGIPKTISYLIQGVVILFIAAEYMFKWISEKKKKGATINE
ncbi:ABC transporter permease [Clostridium frigidicarnis]|uniref:Nucleoside ABC transporter membrane protein n=1 Tax=Clostridium frigidicarnis TaxID=84698 RepID=A0A1I0ZRJ4_9CLOT|nr:ABC transporter permease [Clostridium frigidicarnis]SFB28121.1 nucleoside ABC transporter membrane protein [Clostridium frigidicarnis]